MRSAGAEASIRRRAVALGANAVGGLPDRLMTRIPSFMLDKSEASYAAYARRLAFYAHERWDDRGERFLQLPCAAVPDGVRTVETADFGGATRELLTFPSHYVPRQEELRESFLAEAANQNAYLQLFHRGAPGSRPEPGRPLVLCVHGFGMGSPRRAISMFRVQRLLDLGVDVALFTQPCHWRRNPHWPRAEQMLRPQDIPFTVEVFGQAISDLHQSVGLLRARGYERVGLIGASLGGYLAGLYASFPVPLDFIFMVVPAIDLSRYLTPRASLFQFAIDAPLRTATHEALARIAPLAQPRGFDPKKMCIVAHQGDRICAVQPIRTFVDAHPGARYVEVLGGHWLYLDRDLRGRTWYGWLAQHGYIAS